MITNEEVVKRQVELINTNSIVLTQLLFMAISIC